MATKTKSSDGASRGSVTVTESPTAEAASPVLTLKLTKPKEKRGIKWDESAVDNEEMGKKSSKCCCIYTKPRAFDESDSDDSDADEERKHQKKFHGPPKKAPCCDDSH